MNDKRTEIISIIGSYFMGILTSISAVWVVVEFILYLVKDHSFNWGSVILLAGCLSTVIALSVWAQVIIISRFEERKKGRQKGESKFTTRLNQALEDSKQKQK